MTPIRTTFSTILAALGLFCAVSAHAGEWLTLRPQDLAQYELAQANTFNNAAEGLYIKHVGLFQTTLTCARKDFVMIGGDARIVNRALATLMFAMANNKTIQFWATNCNTDYIEAKNLMLINQ
ncbi:hypothetical protein [Roseateles chitinivorans]|uniref:hypothetical protein n=1 Tax=Roseateles chitinivorans TaxID=2917965 RepID=UPI003D66F37F